MQRRPKTLAEWLEESAGVEDRPMPRDVRQPVHVVVSPLLCEEGDE